MALTPETICDIIRPAVELLGFELVGCELHGGGKNTQLRVFIDAENGVTIDDCAKASRQISSVLDVADPIVGAYMLEVSSPGTDRPLFNEADYKRFAGHCIKVHMSVAHNERSNFKGQLVGVVNGDIVIEVDGEDIALPMADVGKTHLSDN